jgi:MerR family transcriptional regulator, light-induced transcriptional regulator
VSSPAAIRAAAHLQARMQALAEAVTDEQFRNNPELERRYGAAGKTHCQADALYHLRFLAQAVRLGSPVLFIDYAGWAKIMLASRGVPANDLLANLEIIDAVARRGLDEEAAKTISFTVHAAITALPSLPEALDLLLDDEDGRASLTGQYLQSILAGDRRAALSIVNGTLDEGKSLADVYLEVFERSQKEIGRMWQMNRINVGQEHYGTAATQLIMAQLFPRLLSATPSHHRVIAACVGDEMHEVGLRIVTDLLELSGWSTRYLGANVPVRSIVDAVAEWKADLLALSTTLTPHVAETERIITALRNDPRTAGTKVLVGGTPFLLEPGLRESVGADAWAADAREAVRAAEMLVA